MVLPKRFVRLAARRRTSRPLHCRSGSRSRRNRGKPRPPSHTRRRPSRPHTGRSRRNIRCNSSVHRSSRGSCSLRLPQLGARRRRLQSRLPRRSSTYSRTSNPCTRWQAERVARQNPQQLSRTRGLRRKVGLRCLRARRGADGLRGGGDIRRARPSTRARRPFGSEKLLQ